MMKKADKNNRANKTVFHKILEVISSIFAVIVICASLFVLVFRVIFKIEVVKIFGYSGLIILTGSMEPAYHPGDVILIHEQKDYNVRDVITFHQRGMVVTHRIIAKEGTTFTTKGDANNSADEPIQLSDIEGRVLRRVPRIGNAILFLQTPLGIITLVVVLLALEFFFASRRKMVEE